jgi:hypothetical protein
MDVTYDVMLILVTGNIMLGGETILNKIHGHLATVQSCALTKKQLVFKVTGKMNDNEKSFSVESEMK